MSHQPHVAPSPAAVGARSSAPAHRVAEFATATTLADLPAAALTAAKRSILDTLAVTVAATGSRAGRAAIGAFARSGTGPATVFGTAYRAHPTVAALVNGTLAHALDFDDVWADDDGVVAWRGHPSVCVLPALIAAGELHGCTGADVLTAYVVGVEICGKLGTVFGPHLGRAGFHPTPVLCTLGAAAAAGRVLGLDAARTEVMLGLAATEASGLVRNFGTDTKPFHAGLAAQGGLQAALLAREGFTANPEAIVDYLRLHHGPDEQRSCEVLATLGRDFDLVAPGLSIKKYPCCRFAHLPLDAAFMLIERERFAADDVESLTVRIQPGADDALIYGDPRTGLEGKFSMQYALAASVLDSRLTLASFSDAMVLRPAVRALMQKVRIEYKSEPGAEIVASARGRQYRASADTVRGDPGNPLSRDELLQKCYQCLDGIVPTERVDRMVAAVENLEQLANVGELTALLQAPAH